MGRERETKSEILGGPAEGGSEEGPTFRGPHPSGPHFFWVWPPTFREVRKRGVRRKVGRTHTTHNTQHTHNTHRPKTDWPKTDWPKSVMTKSVPSGGNCNNYICNFRNRPLHGPSSPRTAKGDDLLLPQTCIVQMSELCHCFRPSQRQEVVGFADAHCARGPLRVFHKGILSNNNRCSSANSARCLRTKSRCPPRVSKMFIPCCAETPDPRHTLAVGLTVLAIGSNTSQTGGRTPDAFHTLVFPRCVEMPARCFDCNTDDTHTPCSVQNRNKCRPKMPSPTHHR